jgi:hypothetical protein
MELAAELLDVRNERELDHFLGDIFNTVKDAVGSVVSSPIGQALGGALKGVAKKVLPIAGKAVGTYFGGPAGGAIGGQLAQTASNLFGLELEGLSGEDREFELARRFVRFAATAARHAARARRGVGARQAARSALIAAARQHAPGLLRRMGGRPGARRFGARAYAGGPTTYPPGDGDGYGAYEPDGADDDYLDDDQGFEDSGDADGDADAGGIMPAGGRRRGTWIRRGRRVILYGV